MRHTTAPHHLSSPKHSSIDSYYTDKHYSVIDPKKLAAFNAASEGPTHLGQYSTGAADAWLSTGSRAAAACVYSLLDAAAKADAWDGKMPSFEGVYVQNWLLSGTAIAYLKVRNSRKERPTRTQTSRSGFACLPRACANTSTCSAPSPAAMPTTTTCTGQDSQSQRRASPTMT